MFVAVILGILGVVVGIGVLMVGVYNSLVKLRNQSDEAFSTMDVYLKRRYDLIPNLVEVVKQYAIHERETLENVILARSAAMNAGNFADRTAGENLLSGTLRSLFAVAENYPQLRASEHFMDLQSQLAQVENDIAQGRKYYNGVIKVMNTKVQMFPTNVAAGLLGFRAYPYFAVEEQERKNVRVQF